MRHITAAAVLILIACAHSGARAEPGSDSYGRDEVAPPIPDFSPRTGQPAPTSPPDNFFYSHSFTLSHGEPFTADAELDMALGVLPQAHADREPVYYFFETEDGGQGCVRLDTFEPEPC